MLAARLRGDRRVSVEERPIPRPGAQQVLIRILFEHLTRIKLTSGNVFHQNSDISEAAPESHRQ